MDQNPTLLFLTDEEVARRYRGMVSIGTLRNWRYMKVGPKFMKVGKAALYPLVELEKRDQEVLVSCRPFE